MYKVFFKDRTIYLGEDFARAFEEHRGLFYRFNNRRELKELLEAFHGMEQVREMHVFHEDMEELVKAFKSCFRYIEAGGGVVLNKKNEFLVIKRNGVWDLPKGKLEKGEDFETAALREVTEETGLYGLELVQLLVSTFHTYPLSGQLVLKETQWFEIRTREKEEPVLQEEEGVTGSRWVRPGKTGFIRKNSYLSILDVLETRELL